MVGGCFSGGGEGCGFSGGVVGGALSGLFALTDRSIREGARGDSLLRCGAPGAGLLKPLDEIATDWGLATLPGTFGEILTGSSETWSLALLSGLNLAPPGEVFGDSLNTGSA